MVWGQEILIFGARAGQIFFRSFLVIRGTKIFIFGGLGTENIDFGCPGEEEILNL